MSRSTRLWFAPLVGVLLVLASISSVQLGAAIGKTIFDLVPEPRASEVAEEDRRAFESGEPLVMDEVVVEL